ncbi:hypothetical protein NFI96_021237, partial [Prochilodus magdalenae]
HQCVFSSMTTMTSGDSRGRFSEFAPRSRGLFEKRLSFADGGRSVVSASENAEKYCGWQEFRLFPSTSSDSFETDSSNGYSAYDSFDGMAPNNEHENGTYDDVHSAAWTDDMLIGWHMPYPESSGRSRSPQSDSGRRNQYSFFKDLSAPSESFTTTCCRPAPIGSRGRAMSVYVEHLHGARRGDTAAECRAKSRGCSHICSDGMDLSTEGVTDKKIRVREKRRRRREKNREKYGDKHRLAFTCAFCKFRTFEGQDIEKHFRGTYHRETLDYIRRQAKFDDRVISFLHDCMVHKFRKTVSALCKLRTFSDQKMNQKVLEGVTEDDYMRKVEVVHCMACDMHIPAFFTSVQQHLYSPLHLKSKVVYKEQLKRESVLTAKAIINNDSVKVRYEKYIKGEDPFLNDTKEDTSSDSSEQERLDEPEDDKVGGVSFALTSTLQAASPVRSKQPCDKPQ